MVDAAQIVNLQARGTQLWHEERAMPQGADEFERVVVEQHVANLDLWHEEDKARDPEVTGDGMVQIKRAIDRFNQRRNDLMEKIDRMLLEAAGEQRADAPLHSETPGMMIDRLSVLELKRYHTAEEIMRAGGDEAHVRRNRERLAVIEEQRDDLRDALDVLWAEVQAGQRRFKLYRQMKMYNDPALNPAVYQSRQKEK